MQGFQGTVALIITVAAAAMTPTLRLATRKGRLPERPKKHPFGPGGPQLVASSHPPASPQEAPKAGSCRSFMSILRPPTGLPEGGTAAWPPAESRPDSTHLSTFAVKANLPSCRLKEISKTPQEQVHGGKLKTLAFCWSRSKTGITEGVEGRR